MSLTFADTSPLHALAWAALALTLIPLAIRIAGDLRRARQGRLLLAVLAMALLLRLAAPFAPPNWYFGIANLARGSDVFTRPTTFFPLPNRLILLHAGSTGLFSLNLLLGTAGIVFYWAAALRSGHSPRASAWLGALLAVTPLYVRYAASDASHVMLFFLYGCAAAAFAYAWTEGPRIDHLVLLACAIALGAPIRLESSASFLLLPCFVYMASGSLGDLRRHRAVIAVLLAACAAGGLLARSWHASSFSTHLHVDAAGIIVCLVSHLLFILEPVPPFFFPPIIALPVWWHLRRSWKEGRRRELRGVYVPVLLSGIPFVFQGGIFLDLPSAGYYLVSVVFVLLACARALDHLGTAERFQRAPAIAAAALAAAVFVVPALRVTYAYQEEYRFLRANLPNLPEGPATILTVWDPDTRANDLDCCLAAPYPGLVADRPDLRWIVLGRKDEGRPLPAFDYYYPGSMAQLDVSAMQSWQWRMMQPDAEKRAKVVEHVTALQQIDRRIRAERRLSPVVEAEVPALTFGATQLPGIVDSGFSGGG